MAGLRALRLMLLCTLPAVFLAAAAAHTFAFRAPSLLLGRVVDAQTGAPIRGAVVRLSTTEEALAITTASGQFVFSEIPAGSYALQASKGGYHDAEYGQVRANGSSHPVSLTDTAPADGVVIRMWRFSAISGSVRDEAGEPLVGVDVKAYQLRHSAGRPQLSAVNHAEARTDDRGIYRIGALEPGEYVVSVPFVEASAPRALLDDLAARKNDAAAPDATAADLSASMQALWSIGLGGSRLGDSEVFTAGEWVRSMTPFGMRPPAGASATEFFTYRTLYFPNATTEADATAISLAVGEDRAGIDFVVTPVRGARVSGTAQGPDGPAANTAVALLPLTSDGAPARQPAARTLTDANGRFAFLAVPAGSYRVHILELPPGEESGLMMVQAIGASSDGSVMLSSAPSAIEITPDGTTDEVRWGQVDVTVRGRDVSGLTLSLQRGGRVSGTVVLDGGSPEDLAQLAEHLVIGAHIATGRRPLATNALDAAPTVTRLRVERDGTFSGVLAPNTYVLRVPPRWVSARSVEMPATASEVMDSGWMISAVEIGRDVTDEPVRLGDRDVSGIVVRLSRQSGRISGQVRTTAAADQHQATVVLFPTSRAQWQDYGDAADSDWRVRVTRAALNGDYDFSGLPAGEYFVIAIEEDLPLSSLSVERLSQLSRTAQRVALQAGESRTLALDARQGR